MKDVPGRFPSETLRVEWNEQLGEKCLRSRVQVGESTVLADFSGSERVRAPSRHSVQFGPKEHAILVPEFLRYVNHACEPNVFFDVERLVLTTLRPLMPSTELTSFYPATEWDMAAPFACTCGASTCIRTVSGAMALPGDVLRRYRLSPHVRRASGIESIASRMERL